METVVKILEILDTQMKTPAMYGVFHLLCLVITVCAAVLLGLRSGKLGAGGMNRVVLITALVTLALEVYKQINFTLGDGSAAPAYQWYAFPWQFCSTPMYIGLLAGLLRRGRVHDALLSYLATFALFAGLAVMLYPNTVFVGTVGINIQTMFCHGSMVVIGVGLLASGQVKLRWRTLLQAAAVFGVMVLVAAAMNEHAYQTGLLESHTFNMFFISPYCDPSLPVYSLVQGVLPFPWCLVVYVLGFTAAAAVMLGAAMGIRQLRGHSKRVSPKAARMSL